MTGSNLQAISALLQAVKGYTDETIEASVIEYISQESAMKFVYEGEFEHFQDKADRALVNKFKAKLFPVNAEFVIEFFEALLDQDNITANGIVFTPQYIANYIFDMATKTYDFTRLPKIIDPGCGCGIFLAASAVRLHAITGWTFKKILKEAIFGIELDEANARRCKIVLNLLPILYGETNKGLSINVKCTDSLKCEWTKVFGVTGFDFIFGNPPYVNTHDMTKETAKFLKSSFTTTKTGVYNIFYAFIEHAYEFLRDDGILSYIVPNNFLTIKSATDLRKFISERRSLRFILDFSNNMVFKPVRTYNCIIQLTKLANESFKYCVMDNYDDIEKGMKQITFDTMPIDRLDINGWKLVDKKTMENLQKIEGQFKSIKEFIRTGIATLRNDIYMVEKDAAGYYKFFDGKRYDFEDGIVKRLYKIPDLKNGVDLQSICRYIIFPYKKGKTGFEIIAEGELQQSYPKIYEYLKKQKAELDSRDKGKPNPVAWYAYGRTQGLNKYGIKLLFPTFANSPRFKLVDDEFALFCNGYAVFQNDYIDLDLLQRILNSALMQYYVSNTSYAIEGGYYCYQKKYIEKFSLPLFSEEEKEKMRILSDKELDEFLIKRYDLKI